MTNSGAASPWSVPCEPFCPGRRPNSENVISAVRLENVGLRVVKKASMPASSWASSRACS
jgi:hypothetical protein